jgi:hypothetical protein
MAGATYVVVQRASRLIDERRYGVPAVPRTHATQIITNAGY